jgi:hypothetical protein
MTQEIYLRVIRWRSVWDSYLAQHYIRLTPDMMTDIEAALQEMNYGRVDWWCSGCVNLALGAVFRQVEEYEKNNPIKISQT